MRPQLRLPAALMIFCAGVTAAPVYHHHPHIAEEFDAMPDTMEGQARAALEQLKKASKPRAPTLKMLSRLTGF